MIASVAIIVMSVMLFLYWFRYMCLLILSAKTTRDYAGQVAKANELQFLIIQDQLQRPDLSQEPLDPLGQALDRDYRFLTYLLRHASGLQIGGDALENRMLMIDYQIMKVFYLVTRNLYPKQARRALEEMSDIIGHFANSMGERVAASHN
jgi:hypothetical protein